MYMCVPKENGRLPVTQASTFLLFLLQKKLQVI